MLLLFSICLFRGGGDGHLLGAPLHVQFIFYLFMNLFFLLYFLLSN